MMNDVVIRAEGLGKKYIIGHELQRSRHNTLRDALSHGARILTRSARDLLKGRQLISGDEREEFWALKDVDFEIKRGDVVGIIGRNGAGKSTLLKILSRITEPTTGRVKIKGRVASLLEVGTGFHPELTGRENIHLNGAILGMTYVEIRRKLDEIVDFSGVEKFLDTPIKRYSSGMYVRLAFSVAAHLEPEILIVDEVLAVGDVDFQRKCLGKMKDVAGHGRTVLFVSHNMAAVQSLCTRGLLISHGQLTFNDTPSAAIASYARRAQEVYETCYEAKQGTPSITRIRVDRKLLAEEILHVEIDFVSPFEIDRPVGAISIKSMTGEIVWGSNSRFHPSRIKSRNTNHGRITCIIKKLPIFPGNYLISIGISEWNTDYDLKIDEIMISYSDKKNKHSLRPSNNYIGYIDWEASWHCE